MTWLYTYCGWAGPWTREMRAAARRAWAKDRPLAGSDRKPPKVISRYRPFRIDPGEYRERQQSRLYGRPEGGDSGTTKGIPLDCNTPPF